MSKLWITFCITFCIAIHTSAAEKTYDVTDSKEIQKIFDHLSCTNLILHGEKDSHPIQAALLAGWKVGKLTVNDEEGAYHWPENNKEYGLKRSLVIYFYGAEKESKLVLKTKPCGVDPVVQEKPSQSIFEEEP